MKRIWKNSTDWSDTFLRRMVSWCCQELEYPRSDLKQIEFGNKVHRAYSGWACRSNRGGQINVRIGPQHRFPAKSKVFQDGFTVGELIDRLEALVTVTAHEIAHCDNARRGNTSRRSYTRKGNTAGSERYTEYRAKQVLLAFREKRDELVKYWSKEPESRPKKSKVQKRAENAFKKEAEWEKKLQTAKRQLRTWKKNADYYRKTYPNGEYPS